MLTGGKPNHFAAKPRNSLLKLKEGQAGQAVSQEGEPEELPEAVQEDWADKEQYQEAVPEGRPEEGKFASLAQKLENRSIKLQGRMRSIKRLFVSYRK